MFQFDSVKNKNACKFRNGRIVFIVGLAIGHFAQIGVFSTLASLLFFDRSAGVIYMFGASATALAAIAAMFSLVRGGKLSLAGTSTAAAFAIKLCLILVVYSFAVIEDQLALWGLLSGLFLLDAFPFLFLTVLLWRGDDDPSQHISKRRQSGLSCP